MADSYKIMVKVGFEKCTAPSTDSPVKVDSGMVEYVIPAEQAHNIDQCEQAVLQAVYDAQRDAFEQHLSHVSRQHALETAGSLDDCWVKTYRVDSEMGRLMFRTWWPENPESEADDSFGCPFPPLHAREWYLTQGFKEIALVHGTTKTSYRKAGKLINRFRRQEDATPSRTLRENTECEGRKVMAQMDKQAVEIFHDRGFTSEGEPTDAAEDRSGQSLAMLPRQEVEQVIRTQAPEAEWIPEISENPVVCEDPEQSVEVSIDDVCVKRQKASRKETQESSRKRKYVHNTIAHIRHAGNSYVINGHGTVHVLRLILAFLLHNNLLRFNLIFFVDGQRTLYSAILNAFSWFSPVQIILDWYHLKKRCEEQLSLALKGRFIRNDLLEELLPCLWNGCVERAIALLQSVDPDKVKNQKALDTLIGYLERNRPYIPCYSVRKHLGLRNSSNQGEKANDLVVSDRQKHNGMSWVKSGSNALAAVIALVRNKEYKNWFQTGTLSFSFCSAS